MIVDQTQQVPGIFVTTNPVSGNPIDVAAFRTLYLIGYSATGVKNTPAQIVDQADFLNQFGSSLSSPSVNLYFQNNPQGICYFVNVAIATSYRAIFTADSVSGLVPVGSLTLTINGIIKTITSTGNQTATQIANDFLASINSDLILSKEIIATVDSSSRLNIYNVYPTNTLNVTITSTTAIILTNSTPSTPSASDYVFTIQNVFDEKMEPGFIAAPEAFLTLIQNDRLSVAIAIQNLASGNRYEWKGIIDPGYDITNVTRAMAESSFYASPQGHISYYFPYVVDLDDNIVPPSCGIIGLAIRRYADQGYQEPPAGVQYILNGVKDVTYNAVFSEQNIANPAGVNIILNKVRYGIVVWGARTLSKDTLFRFVSTRIICNVVVNSLRKGFDFEIFSSIGGNGQLLFDIQRKAVVLLDELWRNNMLFGATSAQAYSVLGDLTVQQPVLLEQGIAVLYVWFCPSTILERLWIIARRVAIGELALTVTSDISLVRQAQQAASQSANTSVSGTTGTGNTNSNGLG